MWTWQSPVCWWEQTPQEEDPAGWWWCCADHSAPPEITTVNNKQRNTLREHMCACVRVGSHTGVTVSFFSAELYCSSERKGSPLGNVSSGDLVAISQTPSYHSSGHRPADVNRSESWCWSMIVYIKFLFQGQVFCTLKLWCNIPPNIVYNCKLHLSPPQQIPWQQSRAKSPWRASADVALLL